MGLYRRMRVFAWIAMLAVSCVPALAAHADEPDPPGRVGRLSYLEGRTEAWTEDVGDWAPISINTPITSRTGLWTAVDGRAEVRIGSTSVRLDADSQVNFNQVDDAGIAVEVPRGVLRVRLRSLPDDDRLVLSAGVVRVEAQRAGDYRLEHDPNARRVVLTVFAGRARVSGVAERLTVLAGQRVELDLVDARMVALGEAGRSSFDDWAERRDREQDRLASSRYVSPEMTGIEALEGSGRWEQDSRYGALWYPVAIAPGWAPYRYGHWAWIAPWGWTWVDDAPWGFAPFHYGRWVEIDGRWGWAPGSYIARPVYAPALVGFYGGHVGISVGVQVGPVVGWFPLAPNEPYRPPHHYSDDYYRRVNITQVNVTNVNITNINTNGPRIAGGPDGDRPRYPNTYRYATQRDAATFVSHDDFARSRPIRGTQGALPDDMVRNLPVVSAPSAPGGRPLVPAGAGQGERRGGRDLSVGGGGPVGGQNSAGAPRLPGDGSGADMPRYPTGADPRRGGQPAMVPLDPSRRAADGSLRPGPMVPVQPAPRAPATPVVPTERDVRPQPVPPRDTRPPLNPVMTAPAPVINDPAREHAGSPSGWAGRRDIEPERRVSPPAPSVTNGGRDPHAPRMPSEPSGPSSVPRPYSAPPTPTPPRAAEPRSQESRERPAAQPVNRPPEGAPHRDGDKDHAHRENEHPGRPGKQVE